MTTTTNATESSLPTESVYHGKFAMRPQGDSPPTYCGIMFPVKCKNDLAISNVALHSFSVQGALGPITIWVSKSEPEDEEDDDDDDEEESDDEDESEKKHLNWVRVFKDTLDPSPDEPFEIILRKPIKLKPDEICGLYVHSANTGSDSLICNEKRDKIVFDSECLTVYPGKAHLSETPFGSTPNDGNNGNAWRCNREFVGGITFSATHKLWSPNTPGIFGETFLNNLVWVLLLCQRRSESPVSTIPNECIFHVLNFCRFDWVKDSEQLAT